MKIIKNESLVAIADKVRAMVGLNRELTLREILYWLGKVKFTPQRIFDRNVNKNVKCETEYLCKFPEVTKENRNILVNDIQVDVEVKIGG